MRIGTSKGVGTKGWDVVMGFNMVEVGGAGITVGGTGEMDTGGTSKSRGVGKTVGELPQVGWL